MEHDGEEEVVNAHWNEIGQLNYEEEDDDEEVVEAGEGTLTTFSDGLVLFDG